MTWDIFGFLRKALFFPPVIYSVPRAPPQARVHNLPPAARGFIALGLTKSPLTATQVCSAPHREGSAASSCGRALTPGLGSAPGNAGAITHLCTAAAASACCTSAARCTSGSRAPPCCLGSYLSEHCLCSLGEQGLSQ